jgi:putative heme iron utilization protein
MSIHSSRESGLIVTSVRALMREGRVAALATLDAGTQNPYASFITVATETDGSPIFLISKLAWHTRNLEADPRASILFNAECRAGDPLNVGRVSLMGVAAPTDNPSARSRFLAKHPGAALYADFADFSFWRLQIEQAHFVGGFGRITTLPARDILRDREMAMAWDDGVGAAIEAANTANAELIGRIAGSLTGKADHGWRIAACDPEGCDLVSGDDAARIVFAVPLAASEALGDALQALASGDPARGVN